VEGPLQRSRHSSALRKPPASAISWHPAARPGVPYAADWANGGAARSQGATTTNLCQETIPSVDALAGPMAGDLACVSSCKGLLCCAQNSPACFTRASPTCKAKPGRPTPPQPSGASGHGVEVERPERGSCRTPWPGAYSSAERERCSGAGPERLQQGDPLRSAPTQRGLVCALIDLQPCPAVQDLPLHPEPLDPSRGPARAAC